MLRGTALLTSLSCVLLAFLGADGGSPSASITANWSNISNTTLFTVPDVRNHAYVREMSLNSHNTMYINGYYCVLRLVLIDGVVHVKCSLSRLVNL